MRPRLTWSLTGDDAGAFTIIRGVLAFGSVPDYENPADADEDNAYEITITANHGPDTDTLDVTVTVTNLDELGDDFRRCHPQLRGERDGPGCDLHGVRPGCGLGYIGRRRESMPGTSPSRGGVLAFRSAPDYENPADANGDNVYKVTVTGNYGTDTATRDVTVTVTNVNELGVLSGYATPSYAENRTDPVETYTASGPAAALAEWSLTGVDAGDFTITGGALAFRSALDYENPADADERQRLRMLRLPPTMARTRLPGTSPSPSPAWMSLG